MNRMASKLNKKKMKTINPSFKGLIFELKKLGWKLFLNYTLMKYDRFEELETIVESPALVLRNDLVSITLIPYKESVGIAEIELFEEGIDKKTESKRMISALLVVLKEYKINKVYALLIHFFKCQNNLGALNWDDAEALFKAFEFVESNEDGVLFTNINEKSNFSELVEKSFLKGDLDDSKNELGLNPPDGAVIVHFEFTNNPSKNFIEIIPIGTDEEIIEITKESLDKIKNISGEENAMLQFLFEMVLRAGSKNILDEKASFFIQSMMGVTLAREAKSSNYKDLMFSRSRVFIPLLHLAFKGNKVGIGKYKLLFDENRQTMDIATAKR